MEAKSNASYHHNYKVTGKVSTSSARSSHQGLPSQAGHGYTNPSIARERVKLPNGKSAFKE